MKFDKRVIIIDDFYENFSEMRNFALHAEYEEPGINNYPGANSKKVFWNLEINNKLAQITGNVVYPAEGSSCGRFRFTCEKHEAKQVIHFDPGANKVWAGVVYLSLDEHHDKQNIGTTMYRHRKSGMEVAPMDHIESQAIGVRTVEEMRGFFESEGKDKSLWEPTLEIPIRSNRLVLFRPWMWHAISGCFGKEIANSRLTHLIFLSEFKHGTKP